MEERKMYLALTRTDGELIMVNMDRAVSIEPCYTSTMIRFDASQGSTNFIRVKETICDIDGYLHENEPKVKEIYAM